MNDDRRAADARAPGLPALAELLEQYGRARCTAEAEVEHNAVLVHIEMSRSGEMRDAPNRTKLVEDLCWTEAARVSRRYGASWTVPFETVSSQLT